MATLDLEKNGLYGENGVGKLFMATGYTGVTFDDGDGTNETAALSTLDALTYTDVGYFEKFEMSLKAGETKTITTDYCGVGEISKKSEYIPGFSAEIQEILEMNNLAQILGYELNKTKAGTEVIGMKRKMKTTPYNVFKFETCPRNGKKNTFYFVKTALSGDITFPFTNLKKDDFQGVKMEFEVAEGGNYFIKKEI